MSKNSSLKRDDHKQQWEETEFPLVCETCLGDNPYVRMTKEKHGKRCKVCDVPFTVFAWQAGSKGRLKKVEICKSCAKLKNVCQVCIFDLQYGLPVGVRDSILAAESKKNCQSQAEAMIPMSDANRAWHNAKTEQQLQTSNSNTTNNQPSISIQAALKLQSMARMEPRYERNLPKLCSFYARGECNRGSHCPFRHELPQRDRNDPLSKQNTKDRFYGSADPVANKIISTNKQKDQERRAAAAAAGKNNQDERSPTTLIVQIPQQHQHQPLTQNDIRDAMYSYGEIVRVQLLDKHAFVEYTTEQAAQLAMLQVKSIANTPVTLRWARQAKRGVNTTNNTTNDSSLVQPLTSNKPIPHTFQPSAEVAAVVANCRPGGGPIKKLRNAAPTIQSRPTPYTYYPSADPSRLGTRNSN